MKTLGYPIAISIPRPERPRPAGPSTLTTLRGAAFQACGIAGPAYPGLSPWAQVLTPLGRGPSGPEAHTSTAADQAAGTRRGLEGPKGRATRQPRVEGASPRAPGTLGSSPASGSRPEGTPEHPRRSDRANADEERFRKASSASIRPATNPACGNTLGVAVFGARAMLQPLAQQAFDLRPGRHWGFVGEGFAASAAHPPRAFREPSAGEQQRVLDPQKP